MRVTGTVKFFNQPRDFALIATSDGSKNVFVYATALEKSGISSLDEDDSVDFEIEDDARGRGTQAANIRLGNE